MTLLSKSFVVSPAEFIVGVMGGDDSIEEIDLKSLMLAGYEMESHSPTNSVPGQFRQVVGPNDIGEAHVQVL